VTTVLGPVRITRAWDHCGHCRHGFAPRDRQLGVAGATASPGLAEMIALAEVSFARAAGLLDGLTGITISARTVERSAEAAGAAARAAAADEAAAIRERRIVPLPPAEPVPDMLYVETDGTGVPVRASETEGRPGKGEDGKASTREVKLARLFTVSRPGSKGRPVMDPGSSTYAFTFDGKDALARLVKAGYLRRGGEHHRQVVALGDGAAWIRAMAGALYPQATHIASICHAREHLTDLANHLAFITPDPAQWLEDRSAELDVGNVQAIISAARAYPLEGIKASDLDKRLGYSSATRTGCATSTSATWASSPARAPLREASRRSWSSEPSSPACTGPPMAPPTSSPCAASMPAAGGTSYGQPATPRQHNCAQPSDLQQDSDPQVTRRARSSPTKLSCTRARLRAALTDPGGTLAPCAPDSLTKPSSSSLPVPTSRPPGQL